MSEYLFFDYLCFTVNINIIERIIHDTDSTLSGYLQKAKN